MNTLVRSKPCVTLSHSIQILLLILKNVLIISQSLDWWDSCTYFNSMRSPMILKLSHPWSLLHLFLLKPKYHICCEWICWICISNTAYLNLWSCMVVYIQNSEPLNYKPSWNMDTIRYNWKVFPIFFLCVLLVSLSYGIYKDQLCSHPWTRFQQTFVIAMVCTLYT